MGSDILLYFNKVWKASRKRGRRIAALIGVGVFSALVSIDYFGYPYGAVLTGRSFNRGRNGLWLRYTWYFGEKSPAEISDLARRLRREQIRYAYFHVRSVDADGNLKYRRQESAALTRSLRGADPDIKIIAWIYLDGQVDLASPSVRRNVTKNAAWLVRTCGFDGIQLDFEPCHDGDRTFLGLLDEVRSALPGAFLSVASPTWFPWPAGGYGWSERYFREVELRCDQLAVMCYDTGFLLPRSYAWLVRAQAERIPRVSNCQVLLGLPTYEAGGRSHNPRAENLRVALKAARDSQGVDGIALFADYTTDAQEWAWYERAWLK